MCPHYERLQFEEFNPSLAESRPFFFHMGLPSSAGQEPVLFCEF